MLKCNEWFKLMARWLTLISHEHDGDGAVKGIVKGISPTNIRFMLFMLFFVHVVFGTK